MSEPPPIVSSGSAFDFGGTGPFNSWVPWVGLLLASFLWRALLIEWFPEVYPWDPLTRLVERQHLFVRHWLPLPQLPLVIGYHLDLSLPLVRLMYAAVGSVGAVAAGLTVSKLLGSAAAGWMTGLLLSLFSTFVATTIVPYQEGFMVLMAAVAIWGLHELRPTALPVARRRLGYLLATVGLALGVLVRYELWILSVGVLGLGILKKWRRTKAPLVAIPAIAICVIWGATDGLRESAAGLSPDRMVVRPDADSLGFSVLVDYGLMVCRMLGSSLTIPGVMLALYGFWKLFLENRRVAIIFLVCLVGAFTLTILRAFNSTVLTSRMAFGPALLCLPLVAFGIARLPTLRAFAFRERALKSVMLLVLSTFYVLTGYFLVGRSANAVSPEHGAAAMLATAPSDAVIMIVPREIANPWNESAAAAIFGNHMALDFRSLRFVYERSCDARARSQPDLCLVWCESEYRLVPPDSVPSECQETPVHEIGQQANGEQLKAGDEQ